MDELNQMQLFTRCIRKNSQLLNAQKFQVSTQKAIKFVHAETYERRLLLRCCCIMILSQ